MRLRSRFRLGLRVIARYATVRLLLVRLPLPEVIMTFAEKEQSSGTPIEVNKLRRAVDRLLVLPGRPLKCLPRALVLYSMLVEDGYDAYLAIGLPEDSISVRAHAWVEVDGVDVGPSPGRGDHLPMAIYPQGISEEAPLPGEPDRR